MLSRLMISLAVTPSLLLLASCGQGVTPTSPTAVRFAAGGTDRPFVGSCTVVLAPRVHEEDGGCSGGGHEDDEGGGPPIGRHYELTGSCQLAHLGKTGVSGRLNLTGPLGAGHQSEGEHGALAVRGRLLFTAANGDGLAGRFVPVAAVFTPAAGGDGGTLDFTATERVGEACSGHEGEAITQEEHEEPVSTGRFAGASGTASLLGTIRILRSTGTGSGTVTLTDGSLSY